MYLSAAINALFSPNIHVSAGSAEVSITVRPELFHAAAAVHGAVYFKLMDDAAFFAASSLVSDVFLLTASFQVYFLRPVSSGILTSRGRVVHTSQRLIIAESTVTDEEQREVGRGSGAFLRSRTMLSDVAGYR